MRGRGLPARGRQLDYICCCHLYGEDRLVTVWPGDERAVVIFVAPHRGSAGGVYDQLLEALGIDMPADDRDKPLCCDEEGEPPADADVANAIADAVEQSARRRRRGR